ILNITSVHEVIAWSGYSACTASKAALSMLTKTLAQEVAPHGVRVLAKGLGAIKTAILVFTGTFSKHILDLKLSWKERAHRQMTGRMLSPLGGCR
ncbi:SDR family NAD(P)-dependent oxidoreductase, partial [Undibacterium arcticum]